MLKPRQLTGPISISRKYEEYERASSHRVIAAVAIATLHVVL